MNKVEESGDYAENRNELQGLRIGVFFFLGTSDGVLIGINKAREMAFLTRDSRSFWHGLREVFGTMKESEGKQRLRKIANEQSLV